MTTENKRSTLSGKGVEVYLEGAYTRVKANGTLGVNVIPRKRRDINPDAPYAGSYIRTVAYKDTSGNDRVTMNQFVSVDAFNKMREVSNLPPLTETDLRETIATYDDKGNRTKAATSLVSKENPIVFKTNVFSDSNAKDKNGRWSHLINPKVIEPSSNLAFDVDLEKKLQEIKQLEREEMKQVSEQNTQASPDIWEKESGELQF